MNFPAHKPIEIMQHLYLGDFGVAEYSNLKKYNIDSVLCLTSDSHQYNKDINLYHVDDICDSLNPDTFDVFKLEDAVKFIESEIAKNHNVLVHCMQGSSRSPTAIIAYVLKHSDYNVNEACQFVRKKAPHINPTFMSLLDEYYAEIHR